MNAQAATADPQTTAQSGPPTVAEAEQFIHDAEIQLNDLTVKASPRRLGAVQLHHRRHRADGGRRQRSVDRRHHRAGQAGHALRQPEAARRAGAQDASAEALGRCARAGAERSQRNWPKWRASAPRWRPITAKASIARRPASTPASASTSPPSSSIMASSTDPDELKDLWVGWHTHRSADARPLYALGRAGQQGRARDGLQATWARCGAPVTT